MPRMLSASSIKRNGRKPSRRFSRAVGENFAHDPLGFTHPHVQNLRAFDVHEIFLHFLAGLFAELFRQIVGRRFADERLAAAGRAVKQKSFRRRVLKFLEQARRASSGSSIASLIACSASSCPPTFSHGNSGTSSR